MDDLSSLLNEVTEDFRSAAARAPWVRASFSLNAGKLGLFSFGHDGGGDGVNGPILSSGDKCDQPLFTELFSLTEQAGQLLANCIRSKRYSWKPIQSGLIDRTRLKPTELWLLFLTHTPPVLMLCFARCPDGVARPLVPLEHQGESVVWVDRYSEVCLSALALLKAGMRRTSEIQSEVAASSASSTRRLSFEDASRTVALDGMADSAPLDPVAYQLLKALGDGGRCGSWIPRSDLVGPGLKGKKMARVICALPSRWRKLVTTRSGSGGGYCLTLPPRKKSVPECP